MSKTEFESEAEVSEYPQDPSAPPKPPKRAPRKKRRKQIRDDREPTEESERLGAGKKLSLERRTALMRDIRSGLMKMMRPAEVISACMTLHNLTYHTVAKYLQIVQQKNIEQSGYYKEQIEQFVQKALIDVVSSKDSSDSAKVRAAEKLAELFGIKYEPEDTRKIQDAMVLDAMARMSQMTDQQLTQYREHLLTTDKLTSDMLIPLHIDVQESTKPTKKARR